MAETVGQPLQQERSDDGAPPTGEVGVQVVQGMQSEPHYEDVREALQLLSDMEEVTAVVLRRPLSSGTVTITVRKAGPATVGGRTEPRFWWAARAAGPLAGAWNGEQAYATAEAAYQAAVAMVWADVSQHPPEDEQTTDS